ncbi:MAG: oligopeptide:H+ symporter [Pseudomonadota bacterium]
MTHPAAPTFAGQPTAFWVICFTMMWERFSFYGMAALLILYFTNHFAKTEADALLIYGAFTSLAFTAPLLGGMLADKFLGRMRSIKAGGIFLVLGHCTLAYEGDALEKAFSSDFTQALSGNLPVAAVYLGMAFIIVGIGLVKTPLTSCVGDLYPKESLKNEAAYTLFYMAINLGTLFSAFACGYLADRYGWGYGFGLAGIGVAVGFGVFVWCQGLILQQTPPAETLPPANGTSLAGLALLFMTFGVLGCLFFPQITGWVFAAHICVAIAYLAKVSSSDSAWGLTALLFIIALFAFSGLYYALYEQISTSILLLTDGFVDLTILGITLTAPQFTGLNPFMVIVLGGLLSVVWKKLDEKNVVIGEANKLGFAYAVLALAFVCLLLGVGMADAVHMVPLSSVFIAYLLFAISELFADPIILSAISRKVPSRHQNTALGTYYLFMASGFFGASVIATLIVSAPDETTQLAKDQALDGFSAGYMQLALLCGGVFIALLAMNVWQKRALRA